jgi:capsular polysaccharide export protein
MPPPSVIYACNFSIWKKPIVRNFFPESRVVFIQSASHVPPNSDLAVWGRKPIPGKLSSGIHITRLEDGFLRSVGLGADLVKPLSWVKDVLGIYYDPTQPSGLEVLIQTTQFTPALVKRAAQLRKLIVTAGLTKYNVGNKFWQGPTLPNCYDHMDRKTIITTVILVPGQVESDASLHYGAPKICTNLGLLKAVRNANPDAYIIYKPHPDVLAGLKSEGVGIKNAAIWCDEIVANVDMGDLLTKVDEVHVLTSLTGFEALLRGKVVTCYGQPFYAGWGLTRDILPITQIMRRVSLDELVACVLILYPSYISPVTSKFISPEQAVAELLAIRKNTSSATPWWRNVLRPLLRMATSS